MWDLIVSVPDHCLSFYFDNQLSQHDFIILIEFTLLQRKAITISVFQLYLLFLSTISKLLFST